MVFDTELKYEIPNLSNDITYTDYKYLQGKLNAYAHVFNFVNNSSTSISISVVLSFIKDSMKNEGAYRLEVQDIKPKIK